MKFASILPFFALVSSALGLSNSIIAARQAQNTRRRLIDIDICAALDVDLKIDSIIVGGEREVYSFLVNSSRQPTYPRSPHRPRPPQRLPLRLSFASFHPRQRSGPNRCTYSWRPGGHRSHHSTGMHTPLASLLSFLHLPTLSRSIAHRATKPATIQPTPRPCAPRTLPAASTALTATNAQPPPAPRHVSAPHPGSNATADAGSSPTAAAPASRWYPGTSGGANPDTRRAAYTAGGPIAGNAWTPRGTSNPVRTLLLPPSAQTTLNWMLSPNRRRLRDPFDRRPQR